MILLIDWGNTYLKYLLLDAQAVSKTKETDVNYVASIEELLERIKGAQETKIKAAFVSSVKNSIENEKLSKALAAQYITISFAKATSTFDEVVCGYRDPNSLGVDRWLAIIASYCDSKTTGVIDIGSAITFDIIRKDGQHIGGQIAPGGRLLFESLKTTDRIRFSNSEIKSGNSLTGESTTDCVSLGVEQMIKGYLISLINDASKAYQVDRWLLTGGGGKYWLQHLLKESKVDFLTNKNCHYKPTLVFNGLMKYAHCTNEEWFN